MWINYEIRTPIGDKMKKKAKKVKSTTKSIKNPLLIGKETGRFTVLKDGPIMYLDLKAAEEKATLVSKVLGTDLTAEQVIMFTFLHEMAHYKQWKTGKVTTSDLHDASFHGTKRHKQLEIDADDLALKYLRTNKLDKSWKKYALRSMMGAKRRLTLEEAKELGIIR